MVRSDNNQISKVLKKTISPKRNAASREGNIAVLSLEMEFNDVAPAPICLKAITGSRYFDGFGRRPDPVSFLILLLFIPSIRIVYYCDRIYIRLQGKSQFKFKTVQD